MIGIPVRCISLTANSKGNSKQNITTHFRDEYNIRVLMVKNLDDDKKALDSESNIQYIIYGNYKRLKRMNS